MPHANARAERRVVSAQITLDRDDHDRLMRLADWHQRSAAAEVRFVLRRYLAENFPEAYQPPATAS